LPAGARAARPHPVPILKEFPMSKTIAVIPGDGIGPEIMNATLRVLDALDCGLGYDFVDAGMVALDKHGDLLPKATLDAIARHKVALKGPLTTPIGGGFTSINVTLRRHFDLYANVRPAISFPGTKARYENIDIITVRENTEGAYLSEGQTLSEDGEVAQSIIRNTRKGSTRIVRYAFEMAVAKGRKKVTAVHKANIMKTSSGLFLNVAREVAKEYPQIEFNEMIVDNTCMQLVMNPYQFDVIVTTNLFGDILSDLAAGLVGGLGLAPGANIGTEAAIFEAVHGSAPDIAGKGVANPCALLLAAADMLDHLGQVEKGTRVRQAIRDVLDHERDQATPDLGGKGSTETFADALVKRVKA
jgi:isocitrate dehydrogenase (NAD+)